MAVAIIMDFPGGTSEQYDAVLKEMDLKGRMPEGGRSHMAGPVEGGWRVVDVWDSMEAFERFAEASIRPLSAKHGLSEPSMRVFDVHFERTGPATETTLLQIVTIPGLDQAAFDSLDAKVIPGDSPEGLGYHVNGQLGDDWCVADSWSSKAARDAFLENNIKPAVQAAGIDRMPTFEDMEIHGRLTKAPAGTPA